MQAYSEQKLFVETFRELTKYLQSLQTFIEFSFDQDSLIMTEQEYQDYKSKYLMLYAKHKKDREVVSVLNDVDFCIELMESDRINVAYIMNLIRNIHFDDAKQKDYDIKHIYDKKKGESYLHIGPPKTKTSARTIPVPSLLMNIIKKFYTENPNHYFLTGKTKPTEPRTYRQFFSRFLKRNGLQKVKFHEIRHTFAVRAIEIPEFDVKSLSEILGHKNVSFTLNVYGSANLQQKVKCMNLLNDLL